MSTLDNFRKEAKRWLKALRAGDAAARARLARAYPAAPTVPTLRDVQHAIAREHDAESWSALRTRLLENGRRDALAPLTQLLVAADGGDVARVIELADAHPDVVSSRGTLPGHTGLRTALHFAAEHRDIVRALLERGADPNVRDEGDNATPLHFAAERGDFDVIRLLVEHGSDPVGAGDDHDLEVMGWLCVFGNANPAIIAYLLAHGARHNLLSAVAIGDVAAIDAIVRGDPAQLNRQMDRTNRRRRPLHLAVVKDQPRSLDTLLALGREFDLDLDAPDAAGLTALDQAALDAHQEMATALLERGATIQLPAAIALGRDEDVARLLSESPGALAPDGRWGRLIVRAGEKSSARVIELLIRHGASVNVQDDPATAVDSTRGYTALHAAAWTGNLDAIRALVAHGANPRIREDKYCATPAGWAAYAGHTAARDLILEGPIDVFDAINLDRPDLIPRILSNDPEALVRPFGAYAECGTGSSDPRRDTTPLAWAFMTGKDEAARLLQAHGADAPPLSRDVVSRFLRFACWDHHVHGEGDHEMHAAAALRLLQQHPAIAHDSLYTAIVCGDAAEVERLLTARPEAARESGGERGWPPILYLCFTRFPYPPTIANAVRIATALLDAGADPDAFYMAGDSRYTALVGVAGKGEQDSPRQPQAAALFQLLLERGANPFDIQVLYNTHFSGEVLWWLELVYEHTKDTRREAWADPNWSMFDMGGYGPAAYFLLRVALEHDDRALATWLLTHGANPNATSSHPKFKPRRTLYQEAIAEGRAEIAALLARYGADTSMPASEPDDDDRFVAACLRMDRHEIERMIAAHPEYLQRPHAIFAAAHRDRADVVALLLDLGTPLEIEDANGQRVLHEAAAANAVRVGRLLIDRGAEIDHREPNWNATPFGFAAHGQRRAMMDLLSRVSEDIWGLTYNGSVDRVRELLSRNAALAKSVNREGQTLLWWFPADEDRALELVDLLLAHGADPAHRSREGTTAGDWARACAMSRVAERLGATGEVARPARSAQAETYDRLARDLVVAFEMGQPDALARLRDHYGQSFTWQELRAVVRQRLDGIPAAQKPDGYFALPHARLLIARQEGFVSWQALTES